MENRNYGIIREQGEYMEPVMLKPEENTAVNKQNSNTKDNEKK